MAKQTLPTNFKDDVLNTSMSGKRKWNISQNSDGTYSITDVTTYDQVGSEFGAGELNATNQAVNASADAGKIIDDPDTAAATTEEGYIAGVQLFNHVTDSLGVETLLASSTSPSQTITIDNLNNYRQVKLILYSNMDVISETTCSVEFFKTRNAPNKRIISSFNDGSLRRAICFYNSDTSVTISADSSIYKAELYGIK